MDLDNYINNSVLSFNLYLSKDKLKDNQSKFVKINNEFDYPTYEPNRIHPTVYMLTDNKDIQLKDIMTIHKRNGLTKLRDSIKYLNRGQQNSWNMGKDELIECLFEGITSLKEMIHHLDTLDITYNLKAHLNMNRCNKTKDIFITPKKISGDDAVKLFNQYPVTGEVIIAGETINYPLREYNPKILKDKLKDYYPEFKHIIDTYIPNELEIR